MVQVVTGDSQEEVMIFRDRQTHKHTLHHNIHINSNNNSMKYLASVLFSQEYINKITVTTD